MVLFISKDFTERNLELFFVNFFFERVNIYNSSVRCYLTTDFYYRKCMMASYLQEMYENKLQGVT